MTEPLLPIRQGLDRIGDTLDTLLTQMTDIRNALYAERPTTPGIGGELSVAQVLSFALLAPDSFNGGNAWIGLERFITRHIGDGQDSRMRSLLTGLATEATLSLIGEQFGLTEFGSPEQNVIERLQSIDNTSISIYDQLATGETGGQIRRRVEDIQEILGSLNLAAQTGNTIQGDNTLLLQALLDCSCPDTLPAEPAVCDATNGYLYTDGWDTWEDTANNIVAYIGRVRGNLTIGEYSFTSQVFNAPGYPIPVEGFQAVKSGTAPITITYCMEWAGTDPTATQAFMLPIFDTGFFNGGVSLLQPPPSNTTDTDQVFGPAEADQSRYIILVPGGAIGSSSPPNGTRVFITPLFFS
jgi:hypothetical protein